MTAISQGQAPTNSLPVSAIVEAYFQGTDEIRHFVVSVMQPVLRGQLSLNSRETAIVGTYYRITAWLKALGELDSLPHYQAVAAAARSLFELLLDMKLIQSDSTGQMVNRFHAFPDVERYRAASKLVSYCDSTHNTRIQIANQRQFVDGPSKKDAIDTLIVTH